jgi:hypothetical protein
MHMGVRAPSLDHGYSDMYVQSLELIERRVWERWERRKKTWWLLYFHALTRASCVFVSHTSQVSSSLLNSQLVVHHYVKLPADQLHMGGFASNLYTPRISCGYRSYTYWIKNRCQISLKAYRYFSSAYILLSWFISFYLFVEHGLIWRWLQPHNYVCILCGCHQLHMINPTRCLYFLWIHIVNIFN